MIATFPSPVLAVAADAVRDLDGGDALYGLWNLFTKCKESLQDGRRLENISWRLWYREMAISQSYRPLTPESGISDSGMESTYFPPTQGRRPVRLEVSPHPRSPTEKNISPAKASIGATSIHSPHPSSMASGRSFARPKSSASVGRIICDMLPNNVVVSPVLPSPPGLFPPPRESSPASIAQPQPVLPAVRLPSTPPSSSSPRVVVVNPTPHPTPPATPVSLINPSPLPPQAPSTHLLPPLTVPPSHSKHQATPATLPLPPPREPSPPKPKQSDDTLKASDRRFFLQQSPDSPGLDGSHHGSSEGGRAPSSTRQVSSGESSENPHDVEESIPVVPAKRTTVKGGRKGKEPARPVRPAPMQRMHSASRHPAVHRKPVPPDGHPKPRPTFNIGSTSSNGSKSAVSGSSRSKGTLPTAAPVPAFTAAAAAAAGAPSKARITSPPKAAAQPQRRPIVLTGTSSEYETDTDDDSWASEEMSVEDTAKTREAVKLREAALEAQRRREMFTKVPKRSYSNLDRTKSGLLSTLMNPDPAIFPPSHPYRTSYSSHDISQLPRRQAGFNPPAPLQTSKSAAALPLATPMTAVTAQPTTNGNGNSVGYRPKGRPQAHEMEMDSDSETENPDDTIQVSHSIAQEKLAALAGRRRASADRVPTVSARPPQPLSAARPTLSSVSTAPIPLGHPYNLPAPAAPSTPRTTRRQMLSTELSESLRRNLLWERQVSKVNIVGAARRQASTGGILGGGLRPLTTTNSAADIAGKPPETKHSSSPRRRDDEGQEERKRRAMARNRSWADDYHYSGW